jgi:hypothetical protein
LRRWYFRVPAAVEPANASFLDIFASNRLFMLESIQQQMSKDDLRLFSAQIQDLALQSLIGALNTSLAIENEELSQKFLAQAQHLSRNPPEVLLYLNVKVELLKSRRRDGDVHQVLGAFRNCFSRISSKELLMDFHLLYGKTLVDELKSMDVYSHFETAASIAKEVLADQKSNNKFSDVIFEFGHFCAQVVYHLESSDFPDVCF